MDLLIANKKANFKMTLNELRELTPQEEWLLERQIIKELEKINDIQEKYKNKIHSQLSSIIRKY